MESHPALRFAFLFAALGLAHSITADAEAQTANLPNGVRESEAE